VQNFPLTTEHTKPDFPSHVFLTERESLVAEKDWPFPIAYPAIAWLCWIPNALAIEVYFRFVSNAFAYNFAIQPGRQFATPLLGSGQ
jgi:hypothetical protein